MFNTENKLIQLRRSALELVMHIRSFLKLKYFFINSIFIIININSYAANNIYIQKGGESTLTATLNFEEIYEEDTFCDNSFRVGMGVKKLPFNSGLPVGIVSFSFLFFPNRFVTPEFSLSINFVSFLIATDFGKLIPSVGVRLWSIPKNEEKKLMLRFSYRLKEEKSNFKDELELYTPKFGLSLGVLF